MRVSFLIGGKPGLVFGLILTSAVLGLLFFLAGRGLYQGLRELWVFEPVPAEVIAYAPPVQGEAEERAHGTITYRYTIAGKTRTAEFPPQRR